MENSFVARFKASGPNLVAIETDHGQCIGALESVAAEHAQDFALLARICLWHNRALGFYTDPTEWTPHSTAQWLTNTVIPSECRLLFFVQSDSGARIGLCGLSHIGSEQAEIYDIVRGESGGHPLLFPYAQIAMLRLCFYGIGLHTVVGAVHRQNASARRVGHFVGFEEYLAGVGCSNDTEQREAGHPQQSENGCSRVLLRLSRRRFVEKHPVLSGLPEFRHFSVPAIGT